MNLKPRIGAFISLFTITFSAAAQDGREAKVPRDGFDLYYRSYGAGAPVVVLSGGPGIDCDYLLPVVTELAKTHQVFLIELRGTGRSLPKVINTDTVNLKAYLSDLEAVRRHLEIDRWTLLGHSGGAMLAIYYAAAHPDHVDRLILVGSPPIVTRLAASQRDNAMMRLLPNERKELENPKLSFTEAVRIALPGSFFDRSKALEMAAQLNPDSIHTDVMGILLKEFLPPDGDLRPALSSFMRPVLVVTGRQDPLDPGMQYETHLALKNSSLELIPRCGHFPWIEQPERFFTIVSTFLTKTADATVYGRP
jgi:proline iminopeptidase